MRTRALAFFLLSTSQIVLKIRGTDEFKFEVCDKSNIYRADDPFLAEKGYASTPIVESNPHFPGGVKALQMFFDTNLKLGEEAKNVFSRIDIAFTVSCKGKIGDIKIISNVFPEMAKDIMKVAERMPHWNAGKVKGKEVDTYFMLSFMVSQGHANLRINH